MKNLILILILAVSLPALSLESPFESEVEGLDIRNAHLIEDNLIRAMQPRTEKDVRQLKELGVDHILMFKTVKKGELTEKKELLSTAGFTEDQLTHISFPWKGLETRSQKREACENVVKAIELLERKLANNQRVFFHCTVGEDRTGLLSGIYRIKNHGWSPREAFYDEMCENGYEHGNHQKPFHPVVLPIRKSLTPLFWKLAYVLTETPEKWGKGMCRNLGRDWKYRKNWKPELDYLLCPSSSKFPYQPER